MTDKDVERLLTTGAEMLDVTLSERQVRLFIRYMDMLSRWNAKMNLTAIKDPFGIITKHFLDSLTVLTALPKGELALIDIGAGAGFPSFPIKIAVSDISASDISVTALDSSSKRVSFLSAASKELAIKVESVWGRAEQAAKTPERRERYDVATARAVADLSALAEYCLPFVKPGGIFIAMKNAVVEEEIDGALGIIDKLGGAAPRVIHVAIPFTDIGRSLVVVSKLRETPSKFPRNTIKRSKSPGKR
ncbi:MAG: 16S rRNA (guanine(527)-N(7))-methyltransferase RsmG [Clostridiales bacterium]|jgi:16S rRNA (guanine527-N7)-methyltransferase|nr:16S rRNA (guanine(527)-N(7))-methyltransferase RsmG [Clostridiales bacterium]